MDYKKLPDDTRIWIYQANRQLTEQEIRSIRRSGQEFIDKWTAHGAKLKAAIEVFHNRFVILFADEKQANASGCSIDKSVRFITGIERELDITLLDRKLITYREGENIQTCTHEEFSELLNNGKITASTVVFNNLIAKKGELESLWQIPLKDSWHREIFIPR